MKTMNVKCHEIKDDAANRVRKDMGDLVTLAESIEETNGLINPILISPDKKLLAGYRRLVAIRDELEWPEIECAISHATTPAQIEHDENEIRKDFNQWEQHEAIARKAKEIGKGRMGRPKKDNAEDDRESPTPRGGTKKERESTSIAAKASGSSRNTHDRITKIKKKGSKMLQEAVQVGEIAIKPAAEIASMSKWRQDELVQGGKTIQQGALKKLVPISKTVTRALTAAHRGLAELFNNYRTLKGAFVVDGWDDEQAKAMRDLAGEVRSLAARLEDGLKEL